MKRILATLLLAALLPIAQAAAQVGFGEAESFDEGWLFTLADPADGASPDCDDTAWRPLRLPHDWSIEGRPSPERASCTGYLPGGVGWYRKHFTVADTALRRYIYFEGVYNRSEVYLNGHLLGRRPNGYASFLYDLTPYLRAGENLIAVRVDHSRHADSRWYTGSGIYRDVWLVTASDIHLAQWGTAYRTARLTDRRAEVEVDVEVEKHRAARGRIEACALLRDSTGRIVARAQARIADTEPGRSRQRLTLRFDDPERWSLERPYLYTLAVDLLHDGRRIDGCTIRAGLRTLDFDPDRGFALNGRTTKVKGVCLHHDAGVLGAVVPADVWRRRLENLKSIGANAIRMSHNPQAPVVYDLCDELGLLVMDEASDEWEFPKRKWIEGWNVGTPGFDGSFDFFEEWIERDVTDMVRRDRNHPSVILWSIGNEVDYPNDPYSHPVLDGSAISQPMFGGYDPSAPRAERIGRIAQRLAACVRAADRSRPVTGALAGVVMSNETEYPDAVDAVGYNYTEERYDADHAAYPRRIIYGSENRSDFDAWRAVRDRDFIFGQFVWTGTDYLGESGRWPSRGLYTGLLDFGSFPKPRGHFRAALWCEHPVAYFGTYPKQDDHLSIDAWDTWNYAPGQPVRVVCYTNAPQARLLLDGREAGAMKPQDPETGIIHWDIPYAPGELCVEGCDASGAAVARYAVRSAGDPRALRVSADRTATEGGRRVVHLTVEAVDAAGTRVRLADDAVACTVEGPARLLGLENSDNSDMSAPSDTVRRLHRGRLLAYVETTGEAGDIRVKFAAPHLEGCEITLHAR